MTLQHIATQKETLHLVQTKKRGMSTPTLTGILFWQALSRAKDPNHTVAPIAGLDNKLQSKDHHDRKILNQFVFATRSAWSERRNFRRSFQMPACVASMPTNTGGSIVDIFNWCKGLRWTSSCQEIALDFCIAACRCSSGPGASKTT